MLRQISYRVLTATSELCRVSPTLSKLLTFESNSRAYRGRGITYDDDSTFDESSKFDTPYYGSKQSSSSYRGQDRTYDDDPNFGAPKPFDGPTYRSKQRYPNSRSNYNDYDNRERDEYRSFQSNGEFSNRRQFRDYDGSSYSRGFNRSFGQQLMKPIFDVNNLPPVEKYFYVEHPEVTQRSLEEVESYREKSSISVRGSDIPKPIARFEELCLPDNLKSVVTEQGYSEPTPIQAQGWPIALSGRDMVGISQTGSGKTLVFVLPAIIHALNQVNSARQENVCRPQVLVLAPTRELVQQIMGVSDTFSRSCGLISSCAYGGASKHYQLRNLKGANICVATPGRLIDFVSEGLVDLRGCTYLVMDEADRMLDMGFEPQIRQIVGQTRSDRQTLMWSATWPREIQNLAEDFLTDYVQVTVGSGELRANPNIEQNIHVMEEGDKEDRLHSLLQEITSNEGNKVLVFAQTKRKVDYLGRYLHSLGIKALCIHGDISQARRDHVLHKFREVKSCVLIATDVAARGLDISDIQCVINYDFPPTIEDYIHRIGRTARGDATGVAHSFFTYENEGVTKDLLAVLKEANQNIPPELHSMVNRYPKNRKRGNFRNFRKFDFQQRQAVF